MLSRFNFFSTNIKNKISTSLPISLFKQNSKSFSSMFMMNRSSMDFYALENSHLINQFGTVGTETTINLENSNINTSVSDQNITAEFMNKTSKLAKRKRAKRKHGKKISLRYR